jgi:hypothetical protein
MFRAIFLPRAISAGGRALGELVFQPAKSRPAGKK